MPRLFAREQLGAHNRAARSTQLGNFSAKLFGKGASDQEIGKAPTSLPRLVVVLRPYRG
jgi:hypothetical protein